MDLNGGKTTKPYGKSRLIGIELFDLMTASQLGNNSTTPKTNKDVIETKEEKYLQLDALFHPGPSNDAACSSKSTSKS